MAQASAIATIEHLAPGRFFLGVGTGFTGRMALGQRPLTWASMRVFLSQLKGLLEGQRVVIDGAVTQMIHPVNFAPARPIHVPFLIAANGPKGIAVARELGDGLIYGGDPGTVPSGFRNLSMVAGGIILEEGESPSSRRVLDAARVAFALSYHLAYEGFEGSPKDIERLPYGRDWLMALERHPKEIRHLIVHDEHAVGVGPHDAAFIGRHPDALAAFAASLAVTPAELRSQIDALASLCHTNYTVTISGDGLGAGHTGVHESSPKILRLHWSIAHGSLNHFAYDPSSLTEAQTRKISLLESFHPSDVRVKISRYRATDLIAGDSVMSPRNRVYDSADALSTASTIIT